MHTSVIGSTRYCLPSFIVIDEIRHNVVALNLATDMSDVEIGVRTSTHWRLCVVGLTIHRLKLGQASQDCISRVR